MTASITSGEKFKRAALFAAVLVFVGIVHHGVVEAPFHFDDYKSFVWNPSVRDTGNLLNYWTDPLLFSANPQKAMYRPVTMTSYLLNYMWREYRPAVWHLTNLSLHLINVLLAMFLALRLLGKDSRAVAVGLIFGCHPVVVESCAYVSARSGLLAASFGLGALLVAGARPGLSGRFYKTALSLLLFVSALASKENAAALPGVALLMGIIAKDRQARNQWLAVASAWATLLVAYLAWRKWGLALPSFPQRPDRPLGAHLLTQSSIWVHYIRLLLWPWNISPVYGMRRISGLFEAPWAGMFPPWAALATLAVFAASATAAMKKHPAVFIGMGWFFLTLAPESVIPLNQLANDRRLYFPMIGLIVAAVSMGAVAIRDRPKVWRALPIAVAGLFSLSAVSHVNLWKSNLALWKHSVKVSPLTSATWINLGRHYVDIDILDKGLAAYRVAWMLERDNPNLMNNVGVVLIKMERTRQAADLFSMLVEKFPEYHIGWHNLSSVLYSLGEYRNAEQASRRLIELVPDHPGGHLSLGNALFAMNDLEGARREYATALKLDPELQEARNNLRIVEKMITPDGSPLRSDSH